MSAHFAALDPSSARAAFRLVDRSAIDAQMYPASADVPDDFLPVGTRLRKRRRGEPDPISTASLILNDEGVLLWHSGLPTLTSTARRMRRGVPRAPDGELIELYQYQPLEPNEMVQYLVQLDTRLNEHLNTNAHGGAVLVQLQRDSKTGKVTRGAEVTPTGAASRVLFVHGTFSKTDAFLEGIQQAPGGATFLKKLFDRYDEVLAFDHATLSVGPVLNAFDLSRLLQGVSGPLDLIAHSRGGLVSRWALEGFGIGSGKGPFRAVLVGCPIGGTSLASPPQLRTSLSLLSNIGTALQVGGGVASAYMPLLIAPLALLRVATSIVSVAAKTPLIDAAVQMIPGLAGQSRVGNNADLARIRSVKLKSPPTYYVVQSDYETDAPGWRFWKWFNKGRLANAAADMIFNDRNDLVVDTLSMTEFSSAGEFPKQQIHDFRSNSKVHHCNYFEQNETLDFIATSLKL
jgi:hypothetical protein